MDITPCKDCDERHLHCHDRCIAYLEWKDKLNQYNADIRKKRELANIVPAYRRERHESRRR